MDAVVLLSSKARTHLMEISELRAKLLSLVVDTVEVFTDEELVVVVTRNDAQELTAWAPFASSEVLADVLNGWMDNSVWNAPKSL